jgi:hypothetical protein
MTWVVSRIRWIMLASGILTCTMAWMAIAPQAAMQSTFGTTLGGPLSEIVVRNWAILIVLGGGTLVYGAFVPAVRSLVLIATGLGKLAFIGLVFWHGAAMLEHRLLVAVVTDSAMVLLFALYLLAPKPP